MPPRVFITYSHDSTAHRDRVLALADRLREDGLDVRLDQYETHVPEGWLVWMQRQIDEADFVVVVCTETYQRRFEGKEEPGVGLAATWEGRLSQQILYDTGSKNFRFIPVLFEGDTPTMIPRVLRSATRYVLDAGYDDLYRHLTGQPKTPPPPIGAIRRMPPAPRPGLRGSPAPTSTTPPAGGISVNNQGATIHQQVMVQGSAHFGSTHFAATSPPTASPVAPSSSAAPVTTAASRPMPTPVPDSEPAPVYRWLHLSDLHLGAKPKELYWTVLEAFEQSLARWIPKIGGGGPIDLLLLTGDLAAKGLKDEYVVLDDLLGRVLDLLEKHGGVRPLVIPVPGNHDLQRPSDDDIDRYLVIDDLTTKPDHRAVANFNKRVWRNETPHIIGNLFTHYSAWLGRSVLPALQSAPQVTAYPSFFPGDVTVTVDLPGRFPLALVGLNTAWSHYDGGDFEGRLHLPVEQFHRALPKPAAGASPFDLFKRYQRALLLQHHPRRWFTEASRIAFEAEIYAPHRFTASLFGHMHEPDAVNIAQAGGRARTYYQAPSFFGLEHYGQKNESRLFGYTFGQLSRDGELRVWPLRALRKGDGAWAFDRDPHFYWSDDDLDGVLLRPADPPPEPARRTRASAPAPAPVSDLPLLDLSAYCRRVRDAHASLMLDGIAASKKTLTHPIERLYTRLRTHAREQLGDPEALARGGLVDLAELLPRHRRLLVEGQPGCGKTTFLKLAAMALARDLLDEPCKDGPSWRVAHLARDVPRTIPVFLRLSALIPEGGGARARWRGDVRLLDLLAADAAAAAASPADLQAAREAWARHLGAGEVTLLLDGLDEVGDPALRCALFDGLRTIVETWPKCQVVVTSRPIDLDRLTDDLDFVHASVAPFADEDIRAYVQRWVQALFDKDPDRVAGRVAEDYARGLVDALHARPELRRLAGSPVMLSALCVVYTYGQKLPEGRAELYRETIRLLVEAREEVRHARGYRGVRVQEALSALALVMMGGSAASKRREIGFTEAAAAVDPLVRGPNFPASPTARKAALIEWLRFECEYSGVIEEIGGGQLRFKHLTFQEYLAAAQLALLERGEWWPIVRARLEDMLWRETIDLFPGCLLDRTRGATMDADHLVRSIHAHYVALEPEIVKAATITAITGRFLPAFRAAEYSLPADLADVDEQLRREAEAIFTEAGAAKIDEKTRIAAAEAIGVAGDRRISPERFRENCIDMSKETGVTFRLCKYPVTVEEYARFVEARGYQRPELWSDDEHAGWAFRTRDGWEQPGGWEQQLRAPNRPVVGVSWYEAMAYCRWMSEEHRLAVRLPTEREWMAAASPDGRTYPWRKEDPDALRANFGERVNEPTPVGIYPAGHGEFGHLDLAGNVWEWCVDIFDIRRTVAEEEFQKYGPPRALRGGAYWSDKDKVAAAGRGSGRRSTNRYPYGGFRVGFEPASLDP